MADESNPQNDLDLEKIARALGDFHDRLKQVEEDSKRIEKYATAWAEKSKQVSDNSKVTFSFLSGIGNVISKLNQQNVMAAEKVQLKATQAGARRLARHPDYQGDAEKAQVKAAAQYAKTTIADINLRLEAMSANGRRQIDRLVKTFSTLNVQLEKLKTSLPVAFISKAYDISAQYGQHLIDANSALEHRNQLLKTGLNVQIATGAELETVAKIQRQLIEHGMDTLSNYEEIVKTATQLHKGLDLSVANVGMLASVAQSARTPFTALGNTIAKIVDDTAVVADRAAKIANELTRAALGSKGINATNLSSLNQATEVVAQIEGFLKGTVADAEQITGLLSSFTRFSQRGGLGMMLGTGGTDFLSGPQAGNNIRSTLKNLNDFVTSVGTTGPALESLEEMLGVNRETLFEFTRAVRENGILNRSTADEQNKLIEVEKRYRRQMTDQGEVFATLGRQLKILAVDALSPFIMALRWISNGISVLINQFDGVRRVIGPILTLFGGVVIVEAASRIWSLTGAIIALGASASKAATAVALQSTVSGRFGIGSTKGLTAWITKLPALVLNGFKKIPFGGIIGRALSGLLRRLAVPILTRILPLLAGFLPGLILTAIVMLWPYLKRLFSDDNKRVQVKQTPNEMAVDLAWHIGRAIKEGRMDLAEFQAKINTLEEARRAGLSEEEFKAVLTEAVERARTPIRVLGAEAQLNVVDRAKAAETIRQQNIMISRLEDVVKMLSGVREDYKGIAADEAKKKAEAQEEQRKKDAQKAAMYTAMMQTPMM